ncbi:unnamed protein product [Camellia sinensis]
MASIKSAALRYSSFDSRSLTQSHQSDPSSSTELNKPKQSSLKRLIAGSTARRSQSPAAAAEHNSSRAIVKAKSLDVAQVRVKNDENFSAMVKKLIEKRVAKPKKAANLVIPADFIAEDLKKTAKNGSNFSGLHRKLFGKGSGSGSGSVGSEKKALTEVKSNTRTLAMVLRSKRELLSQNKEQEGEITELKMMLEGKNREDEEVLGIYGGRLWTSGKIANTSMAKDCWRWWTRRPRIDWFNMIVKSLIHYELEKKTKDCWREPTKRLTLGINLCIECKSEITELGLCTSSHVFYHCDERLIGPTMNLVTNLNSTGTLYGVNTTIVDFGFVRKEEEKEETPVAFEC